MIRHRGKTAAGQLGHQSAGFRLRHHDGGGVNKQKKKKKNLQKDFSSSLAFFFFFFAPPEQKRSNNTASGTHRKHNRVFPSQRHPAEEGREHLSAPTSGFEKCGLSRSSFYLRISPSAAPTHLTDLQKYELIKACL